MRNAPVLFTLSLATAAVPVWAADWQAISAERIASVEDDDLARHADDAAFLNGIVVSEMRFSENGFVWHLIRFVNENRQSGPLWVVPHDDENAAFEAMIAAVRRHGGVGIAVNSGSGSARRQTGFGSCGIFAAPTTACDPNRNFDVRSPLFTSAILAQRPQGQPVIALHTNSPGFGGDGGEGAGEISIYDPYAFSNGILAPRADGFFGNRKITALNDPDVYAILPYRFGTGITPDQWQCRQALTGSGVNVWHERTYSSDGSLSNHLTVNQLDIAYVNFEAKRESDLSVAAGAQTLMIDAYLAGCASLWNKPVAAPASGPIVP